MLKVKVEKYQGLFSNPILIFRAHTTFFFYQFNYYSRELYSMTEHLIQRSILGTLMNTMNPYPKSTERKQQE